MQKRCVSVCNMHAGHFLCSACAALSKRESAVLGDRFVRFVVRVFRFALVEIVLHLFVFCRLRLETEIVILKE